MSLENLKLGMGLGKSLYQKIPTKYVPFDGFDFFAGEFAQDLEEARRDTNFVAIVLLGAIVLWGLGVL